MVIDHRDLAKIGSTVALGPAKLGWEIWNHRLLMRNAFYLLKSKFKISHEYTPVVTAVEVGIF